MRLTILGCAGSFPSADSAASGYLVQADDEDGRTWSVVLDLGSGALGALQKYGDARRLDAIGVSHLHVDHVADVAALHVLRKYDPTGALPAVPLFGPAGTADRVLQLSGSEHPSEQFDVASWEAGAAVVVGPLTLTPIPVEHPVPAFGLRVTGPSSLPDGGTATLSYSGDTDTCPGLDALATDVDLLLVEAAYLEGRDDHLRGIHLTGRRAGQAAARGGARRMVLTHIPAWNDPAVTEAEARAVYDGPIALAYPGAVYVV
ncbi:MBL fold metallo-hydrolase [Cellulomonas sp. URHD0024]|uniref:MBL fold metallo-hydrolase n=1 Tax=Cellulomonas sp. URHD0024 TaxID=1302620 RepID=UPI000418363C|nr:MBL fold metallo-hydrolase [Cellulomonas sp. URHD0024]